MILRRQIGKVGILRGEEERPTLSRDLSGRDVLTTSAYRLPQGWLRCALG